MVRKARLLVANQTALKFFAAAIAISLPSVSASAPMINSISTNSLGELTILGDNFGGGPQVKLYDDFNNTKQSPDGKLELIPSIGQWDRHNNSGYTESKRNDDKSDQVLIVRDTSLQVQANIVFAIDDINGVHGKKHFQEIYLSYTEKDLKEFPGRNGTIDSFSDISSSKSAWLMFGNRGDNTSYAVSKGEPAGHDLVISTWTGSSFATGGNNTAMSPSFWHHELRNNWAFQDWNTISFHAKLNPESPYSEAEGFISFVNKNFYLKKVRKGNFMSDQTESGVPYPFWDRVKFYAWDRYTESDVKRATDNIYIAIGNNANARVVFTDHELLGKSKVLVHALPVSWSNKKITTKIPNDSRLPRYVHVITSNEESSGGYYTCTNCPNPTKLEVK